jgi:DMSO/TMAO reductase YedYZ molybdopterin-dependent catalytic subunit
MTNRAGFNHQNPDLPPCVVYYAHGVFRERPLAPPHELSAGITPTDKLFMLAHLGLLRLTPDKWRLDVTGLVEQPLRLRRPDLARFAPARVEAVHQCAGNPLTPAVATRRVPCVTNGT